MFKRILFAMLAVAATTGVAPAQEQKGPNGGMVASAQGHPIEFVVKGQDIAFYLRDDDGSPLATKAMQGRAIIQESGKTTTVKLVPVDPNLLVGKLGAPLGAKARVVFSARFRAGSHSHTLTARYVTR